MDPRFQSSFIPKKPIVSAGTRAPSTINLFSLLATVIFIVAIALSVGVYFYRGVLEKQIASSAASLDRARAAFEPDTINQIIRLDTRIETGKSLLKSHVAVTPLFDFLSAATLKSVRFRDFNFSYLAPDKIGVTMKGQAASYAAVALESDLLNSKKQLKNTILSDMALDAQGTVTFGVSTTIDPSLLSYAPTVTSAAPASAPAAAPSVPAPTSTNQKAQ